MKEDRQTDRQTDRQRGWRSAGEGGGGIKKERKKNSIREERKRKKESRNIRQAERKIVLKLNSLLQVKRTRQCFRKILVLMQ